MPMRIQRKQGERIRYVTKQTGFGRSTIRQAVIEPAPKRTDGVPPCEACGDNQWRTVVKTASWRCRNCGTLREKPWAEAVLVARESFRAMAKKLRIFPRRAAPASPLESAQQEIRNDMNMRIDNRRLGLVPRFPS